jgi:integrase
MDPAGGRITYREHATSWLSEKVDIKEKTQAGYQGLLTSRVLPTFGEYQLRHIEPGSVRSWVAELVKADLSPSRIRQAHQVLRSSLAQAVQDGHIGRNPADGIGLPRQHQREMLFLTSNQLRDLAQFAAEFGQIEGTLVTLLGYTGLRWSELVALRRRSIDPLNRRIYVREAATEISGRLVFDTPKSHRQRTVVVPKSVLGLLDLDRRTEDLMFTAAKGGPLRSANFRTRLWLPAVERLTETAPQLHGLRIHDLRHTAASLAISCGANIKAVQRMLGHRHASVTLDRYGHLYDSDLEDLAERLDETYRDAA